MYRTFKHWLLTGIMSGLSAVILLWIVLYNFHIKLIESGRDFGAEGVYSILSPAIIIIMLLFVFLFFFIISSFPGFVIFLSRRQVLTYLDHHQPDVSHKELSSFQKSLTHRLEVDEREIKKEKKQIKKLQKKASKRKPAKKRSKKATKKKSTKKKSTRKKASKKKVKKKRIRR